MKSVHEIAEAIYERELSPDEFDRRCAAALAEEDAIVELCEVVRWFRRRHPEALGRLRFARRQKAAWTRS